MTSCERFDSLLSAYLELEASPAETRFVDGHLTVCGRCRIQAQDTASMLRLLSQQPRVAVSDDFTDRVLARVRDLEPAGLDQPLVEVTRFPVQRWAMPLAAAAALAIAFLALSNGWNQDVPRLSADQQTPTAAAIDQAQTLTPSTAVREGEFPAVRTLPQVLPATSGEEESATAIGMMRDAYVLDDWILRQPTGGGAPVLTRVGVSTDNRVMVTF